MRNDFALAYNHGVNNGSGVLAGSWRHGQWFADATSFANVFERRHGWLFPEPGTARRARQRCRIKRTTTGTAARVSAILSAVLWALLCPISAISDSSFRLLCAGSIVRNEHHDHLISFGVGWHERPLLF